MTDISDPNNLDAIAETLGAALNLQFRTFADEFLADPYHSKGKAYEKAFPEMRAKNSSSYGAARLLQRADVKAYINARMRAMHCRLEIDQEKVLREIAANAFFDPRELFDTEGNLKHVSELPTHVAAGIASIEVVREKRTIKRVKETEQYSAADGEVLEVTSADSITKIKFNDKLKALQYLGQTRELKLFTDVKELAGSMVNRTVNINLDAMDIEQATAMYMSILNG